MSLTLQQMMKDHPKLATIKDRPRMTRHALAAHNLRIVLRGTFPGRRFSVRSSAYANGSSLLVSWQDWDLEPSDAKEFQKQVQSICEVFSYGQYKGMDDSFDHNTGEARVINEALGATKYVFAQPETMSMEERAQMRAEQMDADIPKTPVHSRPGPGKRF